MLRSAVLAVAEQGNLLNAPDVYMDKLAIGPGYPEGVIDLSKSPSDNVRAIAAAKGVQPDEIIACVLDRPRHAALIAGRQPLLTPARDANPALFDQRRHRLAVALSWAARLLRLPPPRPAT